MVTFAFDSVVVSRQFQPPCSTSSVQELGFLQKTMEINEDELKALLGQLVAAGR